jgi:hypothetical protein
MRIIVEHYGSIEKFLKEAVVTRECVCSKCGNQHTRVVRADQADNPPWFDLAASF